MTTKTTICCDACPAEYPLADTNKFIRLWDKSQFDLCDDCYKRMMDWVKRTCMPRIGEVTIPYRGSLTDLATDIAFELTPEQARVVINELERFFSFDLKKFKSE
jgi:hypothetical protein